MEAQEPTLEQLHIENIHPHYTFETYNEKEFGLRLSEDE